MKMHRTKLVTSPADVPDGFVQIARVATNQREAVWLSRAHTNGEIAAVKLARWASDRTGRVFIDPEQGRKLLDARRQAFALRHGLTEAEPLAQQVQSVSTDAVVSTLRDLALAVRDLQAAVELLNERLSLNDAPTY